MKAAIEKIKSRPMSCFQCYQRIDQSFDFQWHYHKEYELTLIQQSRGYRFVGDCIEPYASGDLVLLGPELAHTWQSDPLTDNQDHRAVVIQFPTDFLGASFFECPEMGSVKRLFALAGRGVRFAGPAAVSASRLIQTLPDINGSTQLIQLLTILSELASCEQRQLLASETFAPKCSKQETRRIDRVLKYIQQHLDESITQKQVAAFAHMSPSTFCRFFKRATGHTFIEYFNELRIGRACQLLIDTDLSVTEVCYRVGFESLSYFNRRFKRSRALSAMQFRVKYAG